MLSEGWNAISETLSSGGACPPGPLVARAFGARDCNRPPPPPHQNKSNLATVLIFPKCLLTCLLSDKQFSRNITRTMIGRDQERMRSFSLGRDALL